MKKSEIEEWINDLEIEVRRLRLEIQTLKGRIQELETAQPGWWTPEPRIGKDSIRYGEPGNRNGGALRATRVQ